MGGVLKRVLQLAAVAALILLLAALLPRSTHHRVAGTAVALAQSARSAKPPRKTVKAGAVQAGAVQEGDRTVRTDGPETTGPKLLNVKPAPRKKAR